MSSASVLAFPALEYRDAGSFALPALSPAPFEEAVEVAPVIAVGVPEDEVERRVREARERAVAETEQRLRLQYESKQQQRQEQLTSTLHSFTEEHRQYFSRVEGEVVQLALAIARKILQREAELDPALLAALVRIALDRMQCGPSVRLRVVPEEVDRWRQLGAGSGSVPRWEVEGDVALPPGDCIVETELGKANFGFEAQLRDVEESFAQLLAHRPERR